LDVQINYFGYLKKIINVNSACHTITFTTSLTRAISHRVSLGKEEAFHKHYYAIISLTEFTGGTQRIITNSVC